MFELVKVICNQLLLIFQLISIWNILTCKTNFWKESFSYKKQVLSLLWLRSKISRKKTFLWRCHMRISPIISFSVNFIIYAIFEQDLSQDLSARNEKESNESLFKYRCFSFPLTYFSLVTFPRNLAQIFGSDRSTYLRNIFFHSFYTFEVMTHFVAEESFLNKYLATLFRYNTWDLNTIAFFSAERF